MLQGNPIGPAALNSPLLATWPKSPASRSARPMTPGVVQRASWAPLKPPSPLPSPGGDHRPEEPAPPHPGGVHLRCGAGHRPHGRRLGGRLGLQERRGAGWLLRAHDGPGWDLGDRLLLRGAKQCNKRAHGAGCCWAPDSLGRSLLCDTGRLAGEGGESLPSPVLPHPEPQHPGTCTLGHQGEP